MFVRTGLVLVVAVGVGLAGACGGDDGVPAEEGSASGSAAVAAEPLARAAEASLAAESYVMTVSSSGDAGEGFAATYQAPDRVLLRTTGTVGDVATDTYVLGQEMLQTNGASPGRFIRYDLPNEDYIAANVQFALRLLLDVDVVDREGDTYEFRLSDQSETGRAVVSGDYVREVTLPVTLDGREIETVYTFSEFGSAPAVQAPEASLIDEGAVTPECDADGPSEEQVICLDPS